MTINEAITEAARMIRAGTISNSETDIRCALNDIIDYDAEYNQPHAIKRVRSLVRRAAVLDKVDA